MLTNIIANAYLTPTRSIQLPSTPGKPIKFQGGHAKLTDERDVINLLKRPDITLDFTDEWVERLPKWIEQAGGREKIQAQVNLPESAKPKKPVVEVVAIQEVEPEPHHPIDVSSVVVKRKRGRPRKDQTVLAPQPEESWSDLLQDEPD